MSLSQALSVKQLNTKTLPELKDILRRQEALLSKTKFLQSLPDKGKKVAAFAECVRGLIEKREGVHEATQCMADMTLSEHPAMDPHQIECSQEFNTRTSHHSESVDDRGDTLKHLVNKQQGEVVFNFGDSGDVKDICDDEVSTETFSVASYRKLMVNKQATRSPFRPNQNVKNIRKISSEFCPQTSGNGHQQPEPRPIVHRIIKHSSPLFEEPTYVYGSTKTIQLADSFRLQLEHKERLERIKVEHATERLAEMSRVVTPPLLYQPEETLSYRDVPPEIDSDDDVGDDDGGGDDHEGDDA